MLACTLRSEVNPQVRRQRKATGYLSRYESDDEVHTCEFSGRMRGHVHLHFDEPDGQCKQRAASCNPLVSFSCGLRAFSVISCVMAPAIFLRKTGRKNERS